MKLPSTLLNLLKELNGYKYLITAALAILGSWYDIKGDIAELRSNASTLKEVTNERTQAQLVRDIAQEKAIEQLHDDLIHEIRLLRQELHKRNDSRRTQ